MENTEMATQKTDPNFKDANYHQSTFVAISQEDQIQPSTFEHAIQHLIDNRLDLTLFHKRYNNANGGAAADNPAVPLNARRLLKRLHIQSCHCSKLQD